MNFGRRLLRLLIINFDLSLLLLKTVALFMESFLLKRLFGSLCQTELDLVGSN